VFKVGSGYFFKGQYSDICCKQSRRYIKRIAPADNPVQLEFNSSDHSNFYIDLNSVRLLLRIKLVKTDGSDLPSAEPNTVGCVNNFLHAMFSSLGLSQNGKPVIRHETN
jgi:hypothetical protein